MSIFTTIVDLICNIAPTWNVLMIQSRDIISKFNEEATNELEKAEKEIDNGDISVDLYSELVRITDGNPKALELLTAKALLTNKWIKYTFHYLTNPDAIKISCDEATQRLVNCIASFVFPEGGKIYATSDDVITSIDKYDARNIISDKVVFILDKYDITRKFTSEMELKAKNKINPPILVETPVTETPVAETPIYSNTTGGRLDENGYYHPIFIKDPTTIQQEILDTPIKDPRIPDELFNRYNEALAPFVQGRKYYFNINDAGNVCLNIVNGSFTTSNYVLDDGSILGGSTISVLGSFYNTNGRYFDTTFVDVGKHPDIVSRILSSQMYMMTPEECSIVSMDMFRDQYIYRFIDFSNTKFIDLVDKNSLGNVLSTIVANNTTGARLRFETFTDVSNFTLVSDYNCKSQLPGISSNTIIDGLRFTVTNNSISKTIGGNRYQF